MTCFSETKILKIFTEDIVLCCRRTTLAKELYNLRKKKKKEKLLISLLRATVGLQLVRSDKVSLGGRSAR